MSLKTVRNLILWLAFVFLVGGGGYRLGLHQASVSFQNYKPQLSLVNINSPQSVNFSLFWDVWGRLEKSYIDKKALNPQKMIHGAISGMVASLGDPYTVFLNPTQQKETKEDLGGSFEGIGAQLGIKEKKILVVAPLKDTPAEKAGIKAGDWIVEVDGKQTLNWTLPETVSKIRGPKGTKVKLTILHENETKPIEIEIVRNKILVKSVEWEKKNAQCPMPNIQCFVAYLKLSQFGDQTNGEWDKAVREISSAYQKNEVKGMVLDLRNNPGGYLSGAVYLAGEFLPQGTLIVQQEESGALRKPYQVERNGLLTKIPLTVLINKGSASASEIVAGALRDNGRAKLVGETSFGKGSVQDAQDLPDGAGLHVTIAKWLLPKGDWINSTGIKPDLEIKLESNEATQDAQLQKALEILK